MFEQTPSIRYTASKHYLHRLRCSAIALLLFFLSFAQPLTVSAQPNVPDIKQAVVLMDKAIRYFSVLTERDIKADDAAWLRDQWRKACCNAQKRHGSGRSERAETSGGRNLRACRISRNASGAGADGPGTRRIAGNRPRALQQSTSGCCRTPTKSFMRIASAMLWLPSERQKPFSPK